MKSLLDFGTKKCLGGHLEALWVSFSGHKPCKIMYINLAEISPIISYYAIFSAPDGRESLILRRVTAATNMNAGSSRSHAAPRAQKKLGMGGKRRISNGFSMDLSSFRCLRSLKSSDGEVFTIRAQRLTGPKPAAPKKDDRKEGIASGVG